MEDVLRRIPAERLGSRLEVLVIDDSSRDRTFEVALETKAVLPHLSMTVLRTPVVQGYGGGQKLGLEYAVRNGFEAVALLHARGTYLPELLPDLLAPILRGEADVVLGSRMLSGSSRGTQRRYKRSGNRVLTALQNRFLGTRLTDLHSGYRAYSVAAIAGVPFQLDTDAFHFDTEILIQLVRRGARIVEVGIPSYDGREIGFWGGMRYAARVVRTTIGSRLQHYGILSRRKYEVRNGETVYTLKLPYLSSHSLALSSAREGERILDVGCGVGLLAEQLRAQKGCRVTGVDARPTGLTVVERRLDRFIAHDLEDLPLPKAVDGDYDTILLLDVIEHLRAPEALLDELRVRFGSRQPRVVLSTPNIGFFIVRWGLLFGLFNYGQRGILDRTHTRLLTFRTLRHLLEEAGYEVASCRGVPAPFPLAFPGRLGNALLRLNDWFIHLWPGLFSYQIFVEARMVPAVSTLLDQSMEAERRAKHEASLTA